MPQHVFRARVWEHSPDEPGSWHFVTLPKELSEDISFEAGPREGFGSVPVDVTIGATAWRTSLFPDATSGCYVLPVRKQVRRAEGISAGETCEITLALR